MAFLRSLTPSVRRLTLGSTVSSLLPLLADYVRYCPGGSLHFIAYLPKRVQVWHFRKFNAAKVSVTGILRACANRSWSTLGSSLPTVVDPGFSDESPHDDDHLGEGDPEVDDRPPAFGAPH